MTSQSINFLQMEMMDDEDMVMDLNVEESSTPTPGALHFPRIWSALNEWYIFDVCSY